jgi:hypothetical protein
MVPSVQVHERWALAQLRDLSDSVSPLNPNRSSATLTVFWPDKVVSFITSVCLIIPVVVALFMSSTVCPFLDAPYSGFCLLVFTLFSL